MSFFDFDMALDMPARVHNGLPKRGTHLLRLIMACITATILFFFYCFVLLMYVLFLLMFLAADSGFTGAGLMAIFGFAFMMVTFCFAFMMVGEAFFVSMAAFKRGVMMDGPIVFVRQKLWNT